MAPEAETAAESAPKKSTSDLSKRIELCLTRLARDCLQNEPDDVDRFCYEKLAVYLGARISSRMPSKAHFSVSPKPGDEDVGDFSQAKLEPFDKKTEAGKKKPGYASTDASSDGEGAPVVATRIKSMKIDDDEAATQETGVPSDSMFSMVGLTKAQLDAEVVRYKGDRRMQSLYDAWDADKSGAIDLVELVVELHKFDEVARDGKGIQAASEALVQCVDSDNGEIELVEFTKVIVLFCHNIFRDQFDNVAEHMLAVASSTSEEAARRAAQGRDTGDLEAADKEEEEFLRATVTGIQDHVIDNIGKLKQKSPKA